MEPADRTPRHRATRRPRAGFTLIELLVTIGIIAVLVTIAVVGYRSVEESSAKRQTQTLLANAESLLKGMTSVGAYNRVEGSNASSPKPFYEVNSVTNVPESVRAPDSVTIDFPAERKQLVQNAPSPADGLKLADNTTRNLTCQRLMTLLLSVPANKAAVQALSKEHLLESPDPKLPYNPPVLADAWGNPLILVPSGGLVGVDLPDGGTNLTITSTGTVPTGGTPVVPSNRPFWASAGPDGSFKSGADNLYSFDR